ncbi:hypothetical protein [Bacteroides sp.]
MIWGRCSDHPKRMASTINRYPLKAVDRYQLYEASVSCFFFIRFIY